MEDALVANVSHPRSRRKIGPIWTAIILLIPLGRVASWTHDVFLYVVSGQLFVSQFDRAHIGGALDQPSITKHLFWFVAFSLLAIPYVAVVRWVSDRTTRLGYWAFALPTIALCIYLLCLLTMPYYWLLQYIDAMGHTAKRDHGVLFCLASYAVILGFLCWAVWPPRKRQTPLGSKPAAHAKHRCETCRPLPVSRDFEDAIPNEKHNVVQPATLLTVARPKSRDCPCLRPSSSPTDRNA